MNIALKKFSADLVFYNAGTDIMIGDPLGGMLITPEVYFFNKIKCFNKGIIARDECVFELAKKEHNTPIVMVTSGGYLRESARVIADSIINLNEKNLIESY